MKSVDATRFRSIGEIEQVQEEMAVLSALKHPSIIRLQVSLLTLQLPLSMIMQSPMQQRVCNLTICVGWCMCHDASNRVVNICMLACLWRQTH